MRICSYCGEEKKEKEFASAYRCKECNRFLVREWYKANKEKKKKQVRQRSRKLRGRRRVSLPETKVCRRCNVEKSRKEFDKDFAVSDGLKSYCKECNIALLKEKAAERKAAGITAAFKRCSRCGERKPASEFVKNWRNATGLYSQCRACKNSYPKTV